MSLFVAGASFGDVGVSLFAAAFGDVGMSLFVAGAHLVMLEHHFSWQAQRVKLQCKFSWQAQHVEKFGR